MNLHNKYKAFLDGIRQVDTGLVESIELAYKLIFEAGNATDIDEGNADYDLGEIAKMKQSAAKGGNAYGMHKQAQGTHSTQDNGAFTGHMAGTKSGKRANTEESLSLPSQDDIDIFPEYLEQFGFPVNVIKSMVSLISKTSHGQIKLIEDDIAASAQSDSLEAAARNIMEDLKDKARWASEQRAKLAQAGADYYGHEVSDLDNEFGTLFSRGSNYEDMIDMVVREGNAKIGAERNLNIPDSIKQAAKGKGLSDKEIKQLDRKYAEIIKAIATTQKAFITSIWNKVKSSTSVVNKEIINAITNKNIEVRNAVNAEILAKGNTPETKAKWDAYQANKTEWPYRGPGAYQTMFKELSTGIASDNANKAKKVLQQIEMSPDDVIGRVTKGLTPEGVIETDVEGLTKTTAQAYLNEFLRDYKNTELQGFSDDSPEVLAATAMGNSGSDAGETYNRIIRTLLTGKKQTA